MSKTFKSIRGDGEGRNKAAAASVPPRVALPDFDLAPLTKYSPEVEWVLIQITKARAPEATVDPTSGQLFGMGIWIARMTMGLVHEVLEAIKAASKAGQLDTPRFNAALAMLNSDARDAWAILVAVATSRSDSDDLGSDIRKYLVQIRNNAAFHYHQPTELRRGYDTFFFEDEQSDFNEFAYASLGRNMSDTRFYFADAAVSRYYDGGDKRRLFKASNELRPVVNFALRGIVHAFLELRAKELQ